MPAHACACGMQPNARATATRLDKCAAPLTALRAPCISGSRCYLWPVGVAWRVARCIDRPQRQRCTPAPTRATDRHKLLLQGAHLSREGTEINRVLRQLAVALLFLLPVMDPRDGTLNAADRVSTQHHDARRPHLSLWIKSRPPAEAIPGRRPPGLPPFGNLLSTLSHPFPAGGLFACSAAARHSLVPPVPPLFLVGWHTQFVPTRTACAYSLARGGSRACACVKYEQRHPQCCRSAPVP